MFSELENINKPCLLIKGKYDPITCEIQVKEFISRVKDCEVIMFDFSGHYVRVEEPVKYCEVVTNYIYKKVKQQ